MDENIVIRMVISKIVQMNSHVLQVQGHSVGERERGRHDDFVLFYIQDGLNICE